MKRIKNTFLLKVIAISFLAIFLAGNLFFAGCSEVLAKKETTMISPEKVAEILKTQKDSYTILDVRTREEFDLGHLDSALLIPVDELETRYAELAKNIPVIVYCRSGSRSVKAAALLVSKGFSQVYDMAGGINAWTSKGYPVVVEDTSTPTMSATSASSSTTVPTEASNAPQQEPDENIATAAVTATTPATTTTSAAATTPTTAAAAAVATGNTDISEVKHITADELNAKVTKGEDIIILDVRSEDSYIVKHIKGAINIPYRDFEGRTGELDSSKEIIIYCSNYDCGLSSNAVILLEKSGFKNVSALEGGIESWQTKGYPVE
jgi:phage shock protein E